MEVKEIIELIITICSLIGVIGGLIPTGIALYNKIKEIIQNKNWTLAMKIAMEAMTEAEEYAKLHPEMTGEDKLEMAIKIVKAGLTAAGIEVSNELIDRLVQYINDLCAWSKTVNVKKSTTSKKQAQ